MNQDPQSDDLDSHGAAELTAQNNSRVLKILTGCALAMLALGFASKPLYDTFCKVTGYGGTTRVAEENNNVVSERVITVQFDSNTAHGLGWEFKPEVRSMDVKVGANGLAFYHAKNLMDVPVIATSNYNVSPIKAGPFFSKLECFCFTEQRLEPGETAEYPVVFFVDPLINEDPRLDDVKTITLSYTFFPVDKDAGQAADISGANTTNVRPKAALP